ncbi:hypothetical protein CEXT_520921 [Caerostris extrusa]|uniref:Uncharacterized protein n=1 Tax=Caerostris extrusa TaxID=172846 RepID=A0AAV4RPG9_CAEEX|nr:hypothetical protein CEXT_520921 [Caerostris extrusa]
MKRQDDKKNGSFDSPWWRCSHPADSKRMIHPQYMENRKRNRSWCFGPLQNYLPLAYLPDVRDVIDKGNDALIVPNLEFNSSHSSGWDAR